MQYDLFVTFAEVLHIVLHSGFTRSFWLRLLPDKFLSEKSFSAEEERFIQLQPVQHNTARK